MFNKEEEKLQDYKKMYDNIPVSLESLDAAIMAGFHRAKIEEVKKPRRTKWLYSFVAAAVLLIGFFTSVRLSPALADYVAVLPGMEKIVDMIRFDKGKMSAIENDYYQEIGASARDNGLKITIDGAIADEKGMVLFYSMEADKKQKNLDFDGLKLERQDGKELLYGASSSSFLHSEEGETHFSGTIDYYFEKPLDSKDLIIELKIKGDTTAELNIPFSLTKDMKGKKTYELNETISIEGQKITFLSATVHPLRVAVHLKYDPANTKKILNFDDLRLVDENGEVWNKVNNGVTGIPISEDEHIIYLQSNYFRQPKELYLALNKLQAVERDEEFVMVDVGAGKIIKQPEGDYLKEVKVEGGYLQFTMVTEEKFSNYIFGRVFDKEGAELQSGSFTVGTREDIGETIFGIEIADLEKLKGTVSVEINSFPSWIEGDMKVRLK
jgi:hypothetical protein